MSDSTENPVLLWGDMGPDVYRLSQIFDPRNDQYVRTQDTSVVSGKDYYEPKHLILTNDSTPVAGKTYFKRVVEDNRVSYVEVPAEEITPETNPKDQGWYEATTTTKVVVYDLVKNIPAGANPYELRWYEFNPEAVKTCGKYVPAIDALVVVDDVDCNYKADHGYKTRQLLVVKSVDHDLNVTFATPNLGITEEETVRAIDYGNEKFMLFFDRRSAEGDNIYLTPDRKLMLYGRHTYGYRLKRDGKVISSNIPTIQAKNNAFIPYARASAQRITFTSENLSAYQGKYADVIRENGLPRTLLVAAPDGYVPTLDLTFKTGVNYYVQRGSAYQKLTAGTDYTIDDNIWNWEVEKKETVFQVCASALIGKNANVYEDPSATLTNVFLPDRCYLQTGLSIVSGELITMEVFEYRQDDNSMGMIMTLTLTATEAKALDIADVTSRQIVDFDVELNGDNIEGDVWYIQQGTDPMSLLMKPVIRFDDGSTMGIQIDQSSCYIYGLKDVKTGVPGREFHILFKYFPNKMMKIDWQKIGLTPTDHVLSRRKTLRIVSSLSEQVRKISLIPAWNPARTAYEFKFLIYKNDFLPPVFQNLREQDLFLRYQRTSDRLIIADKKYYHLMNSGMFQSVDVSTKVGSLVSVVESELGYILYEAISERKTDLRNIQFMNRNNNIEEISIEESGKLFGEIQHAVIATKVWADNLTASETYAQNVAFKLQSMMVEVVPLKWLIGDDCSNFKSEELLPYGQQPRPYLIYSDNAVVVEGTTIKTDTFKVPMSFATVDVFLESFYRRAVKSDWPTPTHFYLRSITNPEVVSGFVEITSSGIFAPVAMTGGGSAITDIGGAVPGIDGGVKIMGTVVMEFVSYDESTDTYKSLYGVPVETKPEDWA